MITGSMESNCHAKRCVYCGCEIDSTPFPQSQNSTYYRNDLWRWLLPFNTIKSLILDKGTLFSFMKNVYNIIQIRNSTCESIIVVNPCHAYFFNTLRPGNNFNCIFLNGDLWILIRISLKFVHKFPIDNTPALIQIMAWCLTGNKPLSEPMMTYFTDAYMHHSASMS